jgi:hypothetical protein
MESALLLQNAGSIGKHAGALQSPSRSSTLLR